MAEVSKIVIKDNGQKGKGAEFNSLTAISPLDGRYGNKVGCISDFSSEFGLIKTRLYIEGSYLDALSKVGLVRELKPQERDTLVNIGATLSLKQAERVKEIEDETKHDVKAMERAFREFVKGTSMEDVTEMIHFGLTSEDVNNLSYRLMLKGAVYKECVPAMYQVVDSLADKAKAYRDMPMLARTHGQPAITTTVGKEFVNMAVRLDREIRKIEKVELTGKLNGAVGNFNSLCFAAPEVDWIDFSKKFVSALGLKPNLISTQINPYEDMIEMFQATQRVNNVMLDINQDIWRYISDDWFSQTVKKGEVGSSTMPQKVNPINFENSEGNITMANSMLEGMGRKLAVSRLQRDLSDSTVIRNVGSALAYGLLAYKSTLEGLAKITPNAAVIDQKLNENRNILSEALQTGVRRDGGIADPYSVAAEIFKGRKVGEAGWKESIGGLKIGEELKARLVGLTPATYVGYAAKLTDIGIEEIYGARRDRKPQQV